MWISDFLIFQSLILNCYKFFKYDKSNPSKLFDICVSLWGFCIIFWNYKRLLWVKYFHHLFGLGAMHFQNCKVKGMKKAACSSEDFQKYEKRSNLLYTKVQFQVLHKIQS